MLLSALACMGAQAATITVNSTMDDVHQSGVCTLRDAMASVNDGINYAGGCAAQSTGPLGSSDAIVFDSSVFNGAHTIHVANGGEIEIQKDLVITGVMDASGAPLLTLDAQPAGGGAAANRIFNVPGGVRLDITGVKFVNGNANSGNGGAVGVTAGGHTLSLTRCAFEGNKASQGGAVYINGANSTLTITESTFSGNSSGSGGGAVYANSTAAAIANSTFSGNSSDSGGAVYAATAATVTIANSTFSGNSAANNAGGAVYAGNAIANSTTIANSTFSGNSAHFYGGAVWAYTLHARHLTLLNNTVIVNTTTSTGGQAVRVTSTTAASTLHNSIVIGSNDKSQCVAANGGIAGSHNLEGWADVSGVWQAPGTSCGSGSPVTVTGTPALGTLINTTLANHGGPTPTLALPTGSPAIGKADPTGGTSQMWDFATNGWTDATLDQRGYGRRPAASGRDIGAYEWSPASTTAIPALPPPALLALMTALGLMGAMARRGSTRGARGR